MELRTQMMEAALDLMDEAVVLLDPHSQVVFWNEAAACVTGYTRAERLARPCPANLYKVDEEHLARAEAATDLRERNLEPVSGFGGAIAGYSDGPKRARDPLALLEKPTLVALHHRLGHTLPAMLREIALGDNLGTALLFHPVEEMAALPHGESGEGVGVERGQADMEDRLDAASQQWESNRVPFGLLWITIDQSCALRKTHGRDACEAMLRIVEQTLIRSLRTAEVIGRWGDDDFLVISHERTAEQLAEHAQRLAGLTRTSEFRWWGDRINLTASIGCSFAANGDTLHHLLQRAQHAVQASVYQGGNHVSEVRQAQAMHTEPVHTETRGL